MKIQNKSVIMQLIKNDKRFTLFQKKVYRAVLNIPKGEVRSYKWVASSIGKPKAGRAVGQALKKNPYTIVIPCHRVIKSDGSLGGYSKGVKMKKMLLEKERLSYGDGPL